MKTSKHFTAVPLADLRGQFAVARQSSGLRNMRFTSIHADVMSATDEAQRLQAIRPDLRYMVIKIIANVGN